MKNRIISIILMLVLVICSVPVFAYATPVKYDEQSAITLVKTLGIMVGDENGNMNLDSDVSRAEFAKIAVMMSNWRNTVATVGATSVFADCNFKHWASPYVRVAVTNGIITGYPNGTFRPENTVALEEAATVMLKLLGYTNSDFGNSWPYGQMGIATSIHLVDNIDKKIGDTMKRRDVLKLVYNTLITNPKNAQSASMKYLEQLDCNLYEETVVIATNKQNNSVAPGYVLTSAGTFKTVGEFDETIIGRKGDLIVKNKNDFAGFIPHSQVAEKYVVYSILSDSLVVSKDGMITNFDIDSNVTAYVDTNKSTYGALKNTVSAGDTIYLMKTESGSVDYITVVTGSMKGPYTVSGSSWYTSITDDVSQLSVMRNGVKSTVAQVEKNDIVYFLPETHTVFAYNKKITGVYEKATPNRDMPNSVTISGKEYTLESATAFDKLSSNGDYKIGDTVTLLLGKDGQIADAMSAGSTNEVAGYLVETGTKQFTNADGEMYTSVYAAIICADGSRMEVITKNNYSTYINKVMRVNFNNGVAALSPVKADSTVHGLADAKNMKIGSIPVEENVNILDVTDNNQNDATGLYTVTYMQRLDGITIDSNQILYVQKNKNGHITNLILNNVTGDAYSYGIITDVPDRDESGKVIGGHLYTCDISGRSYNCTLNYGSAFKTCMPAAFLLSGPSVAGMKALKAYPGIVKAIDEGTITVASNTYLMSDKVVAYKVVASGSNLSAFTILPLSELKNNLSSYSVTAYYDKFEDKGGRVRVIVAKQK